MSERYSIERSIKVTIKRQEDEKITNKKDNKIVLLYASNAKGWEDMNMP